MWLKRAHIVYGWSDKGADFNCANCCGYYDSTLPHSPLDGEVFRVHGLAHGKRLTSGFLLAELHVLL